MTNHTCSHRCELPACIKQQRDDLVQNLALSVADQAAMQQDRDDLMRLGEFAVRVMNAVLDVEEGDDEGDEPLGLTFDAILAFAQESDLMRDMEMTVPCGPDCECTGEAQEGSTVECSRLQPALIRAIARTANEGIVQ